MTVRLLWCIVDYFVVKIDICEYIVCRSAASRVHWWTMLYSSKFWRRMIMIKRVVVWTLFAYLFGIFFQSQVWLTKGKVIFINAALYLLVCLIVVWKQLHIKIHIKLRLGFFGKSCQVALFHHNIKQKERSKYYVKLWPTTNIKSAC